MAPNRERPRRGDVHRAKKTDMELHLETRRAEMYAAEGHSEATGIALRTAPVRPAVNGQVGVALPQFA